MPRPSPRGQVGDGVRVAAAELTAAFVNRADLARVTVPTLVVQSAEDAIAPREVGEFDRDQIPGRRLVPLDAVGHCPQLSEHAPCGYLSTTLLSTLTVDDDAAALTVST